jgi:hypothetical protein
VSGAELGLLQGEFDAFPAAQECLDGIRTVADDNDYRSRGQGIRRLDDLLDHGTPGDGMKDLRQRRLHSRSLPGGENDNVSSGH